MARPPRPEQFAALTRIRECVAEHGEEVGVRLARADFPKIDKGTWSRWCKQVRDEDALATQSMPVVRVQPSPLNAEPDADAKGGIDFFGQVRAMMRACDALSDYAWPVEPSTGARKVRNPMMLERSTRLRATVLDLAQRRDEAVWAIDRMRATYDDVMSAITTALDGDRSDSARRVVQALRDLQERRKVNERYIGLKAEEAA